MATVPAPGDWLRASGNSNHEKVRGALEGAIAASPFGEIAKRNMAMFEAATSAFRPASPSEKAKDDVAELKAQLAALQDKIEKLGK